MRAAAIACRKFSQKALNRIQACSMEMSALVLRSGKVAKAYLHGQQRENFGLTRLNEL